MLLCGDATYRISAWIVSIRHLELPAAWSRCLF
jgi:hypothetical protein